MYSVAGYSFLNISIYLFFLFRASIQFIILNHGLEFYVPRSKINRKLILSKFEFSYKHKPTSTDALTPFKTRLVDLAHMYSGSTIDKYDFYFHREHLNDVKSLQHYI